MNWRQNPTRVAWLVLTVNLLLCCLLVVAVPLGLRSYLLHATRAAKMFVTTTVGTAQVWAPNAQDPTAVSGSKRRAVVQASRLVTDAVARAVLTIATDEAGVRSLATVQLDPDSGITIEAARIPRFTLSQDPSQVAVNFGRGRLFIDTQAADNRNVTLSLTTPQAAITLAVGTFDISIDGDETLLRVRSGQALVMAEGQQVTVNGGERVTILASNAPELPVPDTLNLVLNGRFEGRLRPVWQEHVSLGQSDLVPGSITQEQSGQRQAIRFTRKTEDGAPNEIGLWQEVDRDVQGYDSLILRFDLQLLNQSVPGGGYLASEYPLMVRYRLHGHLRQRPSGYQGFYYLGSAVGRDLGGADTRAKRCRSAVWYTYESPNLFELLQDNSPGTHQHHHDLCRGPRLRQPAYQIVALTRAMNRSMPRICPVRGPKGDDRIRAIVRAASWRRCCCLFLALAAYQLHLPGLHYDEAKEAGLNAMQLVTCQPVTAFREATVQVGPWRLPLMVQDYIGALNVLLALPFLALGGDTVVALRWLPLLIAALTLVLAWRLARRLGGPAAAAATALLLAVNPSFIFWSRQGIFVTNLTALLFMASLLTGLRWWQSGAPARSVADGVPVGSGHLRQAALRVGHRRDGGSSPRARGRWTACVADVETGSWKLKIKRRSSQV